MSRGKKEEKTRGRGIDWEGKREGRGGGRERYRLESLEKKKKILMDVSSTRRRGKVYILIYRLGREPGREGEGEV